MMKQVTFLNNRLKRALQKNRFEQMSADTAQYTAQLAVIAQAVTVDTHEVKNPADIDKWFQYSAEMRDAAGELESRRFTPRISKPQRPAMRGSKRAARLATKFSTTSWRE